MIIVIIVIIIMILYLTTNSNGTPLQNTLGHSKYNGGASPELELGGTLLAKGACNSHPVDCWMI